MLINNFINFKIDDDKRLQTFDKITTYPYGTNAFKVCESEMIAEKIHINKKWTNLITINQDKGIFIMPLVFGVH